MARILSREQSIASDAIDALSDLARRMGYSCAKVCRERSRSFLHESASVRRDCILDASSLRRALRFWPSSSGESVGARDRRAKNCDNSDCSSSHDFSCSRNRCIYRAKGESRPAFASPSKKATSFSASSREVLPPTLESSDIASARALWLSLLNSG